VLCLLGCGSVLWAQAPRIKAFPEGAPYPFVVATQHDSLLEGGAPLLLFLHGRSLSGTDLALVQRYGVIDAMKRGTQVPALVVAPQLRKGESWEPARVAGVLDWVEERYRTDRSRV
jgi:predicted peptidase